MGRMTGKIALVTGATSGIGAATAILLAKEGASVVVSGRRETEGEAIVSQIQKAGGNALFVRADVAQEADVKRLIEQTTTTYGKIDAVFHNAGVEGTFGPTPDSDDAIWEYTIGINLKGSWHVLKNAIPTLLATGGGSIVITGSVVGSVGMANAAIYSASKGGVDALVRSVAIEYANQNIRVNVVSPGPIATDMAARAFGSLETANSYLGTQVPQGRMGLPEEVAEAALFLLSSESNFITGQILNVDGGWTAK